MVFLKERIGRLLEDIQKLCHTDEVKLDSFKMIKSAQRFEDIATLDTSAWPQMEKDMFWGGHHEYYWFETHFTVPPHLAGKTLEYHMITGPEDDWATCNPQFSMYVNGKLLQGLDMNHYDAVLCESAVPGDEYHIILSAFTGDDNFHLCMEASVRVLDSETERYYYDIKVPHDLASLMPPGSDDYITIITSLNESLNLLDLRQPGSDAYYASLKQAQAYITDEFYAKRCGGPAPTVQCVGSTHIDVAWLWPLAVTRDKAVRSFSTAVRLMEQYPEYLFMCSQPQLYQFVKQDAPELYEKIKQLVAAGRWEVEGGMWLEADCNISGGEALIRQFVHGLRFFKEEFGRDNEVLWLPDVFGYSAAMPQIMAGCGIKYFMTTKISWNEFNKMPWDTFMWEGLDGSRVLTHFIPAKHYQGHRGYALTEEGETPYRTTYNGDLNPDHVMGAWERYQQKYLNDTVLFAYGHGDGGGGPTKDMLENQRRLAQGLPGCPRTVDGFVLPFFQQLQADVAGNKYLPSWVGELYFEYHRGTYTSMARNKRDNRRSEFALMNAEWLGWMDKRFNSSTYPTDVLSDCWETVLKNQFHDILPGSAIHQVYEDSQVDYAHVLGQAATLIQQSATSLAAQVDAPEGSLVLFNPLGHASTSPVAALLPEGLSVYDGDTPLACQRSGEGLVFLAENLPSKGYKTFAVKPAAEAAVADTPTASPALLENRFFRITLDDKGRFTSLFDKQNQREVLKPGQLGNVIMSYEDRPHNFDAWDINNYYIEKSWEVDGVTAIEVVEAGPVFATLKIARTYLNSTVDQYITLYADLPRVDIRHDIDWKESQILLKLLFPVDVHASEATYEIQFGNVKRPTHHNTSWDYARFEVLMHKWMDLSEADYGVSFLNDSKFGASVKDGLVGLTMLKSGTHPNPVADQERHGFTFSIVPHAGSWRQADTVQMAYALNNPPIAAVKAQDGGSLPAQYSLVQCSAGNVVLESVKQAEDGQGLVLRLYECHGSRTDTALQFADALASAAACDMLENLQDTLPCDGTSLSFTMYPYEIKTLKVQLKA